METGPGTKKFLLPAMMPSVTLYKQEVAAAEEAAVDSTAFK